MILYIGERHQSFYLNDIIASMGEELEVLDNNNVKQCISPATANRYSHIIIDVNIFANEVDEITSSIITIQQVTNANIVLLTVGISPRSNMIVALYNAGFKNFVTGQFLDEKKEQTRKCLDGYYAMNPIPFEEEIVSVIAEQEQAKNPKQEITIETIRQSQKRKVSVGVCGCTHRIGATTQALQIVKYLTLKGYKACYIELNNSNWILDYIDTRSEDEYRYMEQIGMVSYRDMDIYVNPKANLQTIKKKDYDFFIYDLGTYTDRDFEKMSFLEKDINVVVGGIKPIEITTMNDVITDTIDQHNVYYVFSFIEKEKEERNDVLDFMDEKAEHTTFAECAFNPFTYSSNNNGTYDPIFEVEEKERNEKNQKKKKGFWKKKK